MLKEIRLLWKLWSIQQEVKDMDKKALLKVLVAGLAAAAASAAASFLETDAVSLTAVGASALAAVIAYLKQSPLLK